MVTEMFYTKELHIPAFRLLFPENGEEPLIDFFNPRTRTHDTFPVSQFYLELNQLIFKYRPR